MKYFEKIAVGPEILYEKPHDKGTAGFFLSSKAAKRYAKVDLDPYQRRYANKAKKKGLIVVNPHPLAKQKSELLGAIRASNPGLPERINEITFEGMEKKEVKRIKSHELVHHLRDKKNKRSSLNSSRSFTSKIIEETAAYGRTEGGKLKGFKQALIAEIPRSKSWSALKKIIRIK